MAAILGTLVACTPTRASAQAASGSPAAIAPTDALIVIVRDASGLALPGASVHVVNESTQAAIDAVTDAQGLWRAATIRPGRYRVDIRIDGFETATNRVVAESGQAGSLEVTLRPSRVSEAVVVTARRVEEVAQEVPIPVTVLTGKLVADAGAFNVNRLKELVPTVQFYSSNPRNSAINIRGLGAPFGLTNDGIDAGVGMYVDGVFFARPAAATLDFLDVEQIEVLRGPQGTLFGKNTTAGAINVTTRKPTFTPESAVELTYGGFDLAQAKTSVSGPLSDTVAARVSFSGTTRRGTIDDVKTNEELNGLNNLGVRGQVLWAPSSKTALTIAADDTRQRPRGYAQVVAGVAPTLRPANRQFPQIAKDLGYALPSDDPFNRISDADTAHRSYQDLGGASVTFDRDAGPGRLTAVAAWRYWNWDPSNDRDFLGLPITTISANPSTQRQWTQEVRYAGSISPAVNIVTGIFAFEQSIDSTGRQEQGSAAARFLLAPTSAALTPGLLDGYGQTSAIQSSNLSTAVFAQADVKLGPRLRVLPGVRVNYDDKSVDYDAQVYGGLQTADPALITLQRSILAPQAYQADVDDTNVSGQITLAFQASSGVRAFATYASTYKPVGLNLGGVPTDALGRPALSAAVVKPEDERHLEIGVKTQPAKNVTANLAVFNTIVKDYQAQVVNAQVGVLRGYLANAEKVRVRGAEFDGGVLIARRLSAYAAVAFTDGVYVAFPDAPPPLELTGGPQVVDISGAALPGTSRWAWSGGGEYRHGVSALGRRGEWFGGVDASYRSTFSSSATPSPYLMIDGYSLVNLRAGLRWADGWSVSVWARNAFDSQYFELLSAAPGGSGLYVGLPGDPRSAGVTLRVSLKKK